MKSYRWVTLIAALLITAVPVGAIAAASPAACDLRLSVELTPDIPDPLDAGFLSSLLSNEVNYQLTLLGSRPGSVVVIELTGPGPEYRCQSVVEAMRRDGRVLSIDLDQESSPARTTLDLRPPDLRSLGLRTLQQAGTSADSDEADAVTVAATPLLAVARPDTQPRLTGVAALLWAAHHPAQAWRVLLPIQPDGREAYAPAPVSAATG
jgi:hypothetical protein